jgi:hypothetical protein
MSGRRWTADEDARLVHLHEVQGWFLNAIDVELGRPNKSSSERYRLLKRRCGSEPDKPPRRSSRTLLRDAIRAHEAARARGGNASIPEMVLGDPPPGRSALDQRRGSLA